MREEFQHYLRGPESVKVKAEKKEVIEKSVKENIPAIPKSLTTSNVTRPRTGFSLFMQAKRTEAEALLGPSYRDVSLKVFNSLSTDTK